MHNACPMPECQTTAGCKHIFPMTYPLIPREFVPVNMVRPQWENEVTVARLDKNGNLTITSEYVSPK